MDTVRTDQRRLRILLADDHAIFSDTLRSYLEKNFEVIGQVSDGRALLDETAKLKPDLVIVDVGMPMLNGLDAARRIKETAPKVKFVFLTMQDDPHLAAAALELGPVAFVLKHSAGSELLKAIDEVMRGHSYIAARMKSEDWAETKTRARQFSKDLTARQTDIVQLLGEGRPMKEIAGLLDLSEKTVEFHKHHIMVSFNLKNNADLVLFALNRRLIVSSPAYSRANPSASSSQGPIATISPI
jgi:DNA-binding NarL/FixJ family response regulator